MDTPRQRFGAQPAEPAERAKALAYEPGEFSPGRQDQVMSVSAEDLSTSAVTALSPDHTCTPMKGNVPEAGPSCGLRVSLDPRTPILAAHCPVYWASKSSLARCWRVAAAGWRRPAIVMEHWCSQSAWARTVSARWCCEPS